MALLKRVSSPDFGVAVAAVHRSIFLRLKWYLRIFATSGTDGGIHLPRSVAIKATLRATLLFPGLSALRTALGLIGKALGGKELLLRGSEGETCAALGAFKSLVYETHG